MTGSFLNGVSGVRTHESGINSISNNIANINTNGYRANRPEFASMFATAVDSINSSSPIANDMNYGVTVASNSIDVRGGSIINSAGKYDLAINGKGWFVVSDKNGTKQYYTRDGNFNRDSEGYLVNSQGYYLQGVDMGMIDKKVYDLNTTPKTELTTQDVSALTKIKIEEDIYIKPSATTHIENVINLNSTDNLKSIDEAFLPTLYYNKKERLFKSDAGKYFEGAKYGDTLTISVATTPPKSITLEYGKDFDTIKDLQDRLSGSSIATLNIDNRRIVFKNVTDEAIEYRGSFIDKLGLRMDSKNKRLMNTDYLYLKKFLANDMNTLYNENFTSINIQDGDTITMEVNGKSHTFTYSNKLDSKNYFRTIREFIDNIEKETGLDITVQNCRLIFENNTSIPKKVKFSSLNDNLIDALRLPDEVIIRPEGGVVQTTAFKVPTYKSISEVFDDDGTKYLLTSDYVLHHMQANGDDKESWMSYSAIFDLGYDNLVSKDHTEGKIEFNGANEPPKLYEIKNDISKKVSAYNVDFSKNQAIKFNPTGIDDKRFSTKVHYMSSAVKKTNKNGNLEGYNQKVVIDKDGKISLKFSNNLLKPIGRLGIVSFVNPQGLRKVGNNMFETFSTSVSGNIRAPISGEPKVLWDKTTGVLNGATVSQHKLETSNVEMSSALTDLIIMQRGYSANSKSITTADEMIREAINLKNR